MANSERGSISKVLTVGEVAARSGVAVSTLHFYEAQGLIRSWRNEGNQRRYPREVLRRVAVIKVAHRTGIPLVEIREALATLPDERTPTAEDWKKLSQRWRADLDQRIARLTGLRDQLDGCIGCGCLSLGVCPLRNPWDRLAEQGPGPRLLDPCESSPCCDDKGRPINLGGRKMSIKAEQFSCLADEPKQGKPQRGSKSDGNQSSSRNPGSDTGKRTQGRRS